VFPDAFDSTKGTPISTVLTTPISCFNRAGRDEANRLTSDVSVERHIENSFRTTGRRPNIVGTVGATATDVAVSLGVSLDQIIIDPQPDNLDHVEVPFEGNSNHRSKAMKKLAKTPSYCFQHYPSTSSLTESNIGDFGDEESDATSKK